MRFTKTHLMFCFFVGTLVGVQLVRKNLFPYNILRVWRKSLNEKKDNSQHISAPWVLPKKKDMDESYAMIPIEYLPALRTAIVTNAPATIAAPAAHGLKAKYFAIPNPIKAPVSAPIA